MPGDPLRNVNPGAPWYPSASRENALSAAARKVRDGRDLTDRLSGSNPVDATIVLVKNGSGADRQRGEVLGIDGVVFPSASTGVNAFLARVVVTGVTPAVGTHDGKFVVLLEPIASGKLGRAVISGAVAVKVSGSGPRADITNSSAAALTAGATGSAQILWREGSGSPPWAIVKIGGRISEAAIVHVTSNATGGGKYNAKLITPPTADVSASGNLAASDLGSLAGSENVLFLNLEEVGASTHLLTEDSQTPYAIGHHIYTNSDGKLVIAGVSLNSNTCTE